MVMQACTPLDARSAHLGGGLARACYRTPRATARAPLERTTLSRRWASRLSPSRSRTGGTSPTGLLRLPRRPSTPPSGTPPGWPGGCYRPPFPLAPTHWKGAASSPASALASLVYFAACGLAALAWASFVHPMLRLIYNPSSVPVGWYRIAPPGMRRVGSHRADHAPPRCITQRGYLPGAPLLSVGAVAPQEVCVASGIVRIDGAWPCRAARRPLGRPAAILAAVPPP